jgi:hypothetical protein
MIVGMDANRLLFLLATFSLFAFVRGDNAVLAASPDPANGHFQLQAVIVDEPNGEGVVAPVHEVFLVDTDTGKVWKYQPLQWAKNKDGSSRILNPDFFVPVQVGSSQPRQ